MQPKARIGLPGLPGVLAFVMLFAMPLGAHGEGYSPAIGERQVSPTPVARAAQEGIMLGSRFEADAAELRAASRAKRAVDALVVEQWDEAYRWLDFGIRTDVLWIDSALQRMADRPATERDLFQFRLLHFYLERFDLTNVDWHPKRLAFIDQCFEKYAALLVVMPEEVRRFALDVSHRELLPKNVINHKTPLAEVQQRMTAAAAVLQNQPDCLPAIVAYLRAAKEHYRANGDQAVTLRAIWQPISGSLAKVALSRAFGHFAWRCGEPLQDQIMQEVIALSPLDLPVLLARRLNSHCVAFDSIQEREALSLAERVYSTWPGTIPAMWAANEAIRLVTERGRPADALRVLRGMQLVHTPDDYLILKVAAFCRTARHPEPEAGCLLLAEFLLQRPNSSQVPQAMMQVAEICSARGDQHGRREWLERAAKWAAPCESTSGRQYPNDGCLAANRQLALLLEEQGDWAGALVCWETDRSSVYDCGTCAQQAEQERQQSLARCRERLSPKLVSRSAGSPIAPTGFADDTQSTRQTAQFAVLAGALLVTAAVFAYRLRRKNHRPR